MTRLRGRARRGERLLAKAPLGHWSTRTLIGALGIDGVRCSMLVEGPVNGELFQAFVDQILCQQLRAGDIVVLDNLSSHKGVGIRQAIERVGATLIYLPPYSPD